MGWVRRMWLVGVGCGLIAVSPGLRGQSSHQMGTRQLREAAEGFIGEGRFEAGIPYFEELVRRFEHAPDAERQVLEGMLVFLGVGYMQQYGAGREVTYLERAMEVFNRYESMFPSGARRHLMLGFRADCKRGLAQWESAVADLTVALSPPLDMRFTEKQRQDSLEKLVQTIYIIRNWEIGVPWFLKLLASPDPERQTLAAAALTEAYIETGQYDQIATLLPYLTGDSPSRYDVRFNLKLLEGGDKLTELERYLEASLLFYMTLTTDELQAYWAGRVARIENQLRVIALSNTQSAQERKGELEVDLINAEQQVEVLEGVQSYTPELEWRKASNFKNTDRNWEAYWAFYRLAEDYPDRVDQVEDYYYAAFVQADLLNEIPKAEALANLYLDREDWTRYRREISVTLAGLLLRSEQYERLLAFCIRYIERDPADDYNPQLIYYMGATYLKLEQYAEGADQFRAYIENHPDTPMMDGAYYWGGLCRLFTEDYEEAIDLFSAVKDRYPQSPYHEDAQFRIGVALFADDGFAEAEAVFAEFAKKYPESILRGEGEVFLGDIASAGARVRKAIEHYENVAKFTDEMGFINHAVFQLGKLFEANGWFSRMEKHYRRYQETYGEKGQLTAAIFEQGRAFELMGNPAQMLEAYYDAVVNYGDIPTAYGIDQILFAYPEKYSEFKTRYDVTIAFLDAFIRDEAFRAELMGDRRVLYDYFGDHPAIDNDLQELLLRDEDFRAQVATDLAALEEYRDRVTAQLNLLPVKTPAAAYKAAYAAAEAEGRRTLALRLHMVLDSLGDPVNPTELFTEKDIELASPRTLVWIADRLASYDNIALKPLVRKSLNQVIEEYSDAEEAVLQALMTAGEIEAQEGNFEMAFQHFNQAQERFPARSEAVRAAMRQGDVLMEAGRYEEAIGRYEKILRTRSWRGESWAEAQYKIGMCFFRRDLYSEAHGYFERTFLAFAQYREWAAKAYLRDAETLLRLGARADAENTLKEALNTPGYEETQVYGELEQLHSSLM